MKISGKSGYLFLAGILTILASALTLGYLTIYYLPPTKYPEVKQLPEGPRHFELKEKKKEQPFDLMDPELAPPDIKDKVHQGYQIMLHTPKYAAKYTGNILTCNHCHFDAGNTFGGKNGGLSLVGVSLVYPSYSERAKKKISLGERMQNCFMRSMNGKKPPLDDPVVEAIIAYLDWISSPVDKVKKEVPWLGLKLIQSDHEPDAGKGRDVYMNHCAACHQKDGGGTEGVPPLWGPHSFNDGAGMNRLNRFAPFVYYNMPYQDAHLTEEQALDVAAFVTQQPRPHFVR